MRRAAYYLWNSPRWIVAVGLAIAAAALATAAATLAKLAKWTAWAANWVMHDGTTTARSW